MSRLLRKFLASPAARRTASRKCLTCQAKNRAVIEREAKAFNAARESGETTAPWSTYVTHVMPALGYGHDFRSLLRHLRTCLGWTIH